MNPPDPREWHRLFNAALNDQLSDAEKLELAAVLKSSAEARQLWFLYTDNECSLAEMKRPLEMKTRRAGRSWFSWRPLTAAAAGIVFGMFCTSVVFAFVAPMLGKVVTLLDDGFESAPAPMAIGVPTESGRWSGDFAEIAGAQNGVTPHGGAKMWRFLRADSAVDADEQASYVGEAIRIVDLQPLRSGGAKPGSQIEISAWFAAGQRAPGFRYHCNIKAAAFEGSVAEAPKLWGKWAEASVSLAQREVVAEAGGRWQRLSVTMLMPANADFLIFECAVVQRQPVVSQGVAEFPAHYLDDVRVRVLPPTREANALD